MDSRILPLLLTFFVITPPMIPLSAHASSRGKMLVEAAEYVLRGGKQVPIRVDPYVVRGSAKSLSNCLSTKYDKDPYTKCL